MTVGLGGVPGLPPGRNKGAYRLLPGSAVAEELMTAQAGATWTESEFVLHAGPATDEVEDQYDYGNNQKQVN